MKQNSTNNIKGDYVLATGRAAAHRLRILHSLYGPGARRVLLQAGIQPGMRVADLGCGVGMVTALLAELVGPTGQVVGVDFSGAQIAQARELLPPGFSNVNFIEASATDTGLPHESFDLEAGLITSEELDHTLVEMQRMAEDETVIAIMPRMSQVWARKLAPCASNELHQAA